MPHGNPPELLHRGLGFATASGDRAEPQLWAGSGLRPISGKPCSGSERKVAGDCNSAIGRTPRGVPAAAMKLACDRAIVHRRHDDRHELLHTIVQDVEESPCH